MRWASEPNESHLKAWQQEIARIESQEGSSFPDEDRLRALENVLEIPSGALVLSPIVLARHAEAASITLAAIGETYGQPYKRKFARLLEPVRAAALELASGTLTLPAAEARRWLLSLFDTAKETYDAIAVSPWLRSIEADGGWAKMQSAQHRARQRGVRIRRAYVCASGFERWRQMAAADDVDARVLLTEKQGRNIAGAVHSILDHGTARQFPDYCVVDGTFVGFTDFANAGASIFHFGDKQLAEDATEVIDRLFASRRAPRR